MIMMIAKTLLAFLLLLLIGYYSLDGLHLLIARYWLYKRFFDSALRYIETHGRGHSEAANLTAIEANLVARLRFVLFLAAGSLVLVTALAVTFARFGIFEVPVSVAAVIGQFLACFAFIFVYINAEMKSRTLCGELIEFRPEEKWFVIQIGDEKDNFMKIVYNGLPIREDILVPGKKYLIGNYVYAFSMAPCDYYEWNDCPFPS